MAYCIRRQGQELKSAKILDASDPAAIEEAAAVIRQGGLVVFPTETVYGLGADACDPLAVARVFEVKQRPRMDPIIVHVSSPVSAQLYGRFPEEAGLLLQRFWPGPLTVVVPKTGLVPPIVTAGLDTVAIRMPAHPAALALIHAAGRALAAPSANIFGCISPTEARHVAAQLSDHVDLILDGGPCVVGVESTVLSLAGAVPRILRVGGVSLEALREILGRLEWSTNPQGRPEAPGQLTRHYATRTPMEILKADDRRAEPRPGERVGLLSLIAQKDAKRYAAVEVLSQSGDLREAAANLFAALHRLDTLHLDRLVAHPVPEHGLGIAIMDRLRRCAAR
ncbi:MAG: threonylcarbamoyl-AMP synthase [Acidobacteriia bacterium]|nr:threonylcarbamoyl-AMP synthase [Terriglobia bacterium]